jgi:hypothetical protein
MAQYVPEPSQAVTTAPGDQITPVVAGLVNGGWVVVWQSGSDAATSVYAQLYDAQGNKVGGEFTVFSDPSSALNGWTGYHVGGVAALADGSFVVSAATAWLDPASGPKSALYAIRLDASGQPVDAPALVATGDFDFYAQGGPIFALPGGGYAVIEQRVDRPMQYAGVTEVVHQFDASNAPVGTAIALGSFARANYSTAAMTNGDFVLATLNVGAVPSHLRWEVVDANGTQTASGALDGAYGVNDYADPATVALANGTALVVWQFIQYTPDAQVASSVWQAQLIDSSGHAAGAPFTLALDASAGDAVKLTALSDGSFVATWPQSAYSTSPTELMGQHFDAQGQPLGELMHLGTVASGDFWFHLPYDIDATSDGGFVLTIESPGGGATGTDIYEQKFDPAVASGGTIDVSGSAGITTIPSGDYTIVGGAGIDQIAFASAHTDYTVTPTSITGPEGADTLSGIERIRFSDGFAIALDTVGHAGEAYRLYQAAFDRQPDLPGLGYQMNDLDQGWPLSWVAGNFIASPEFQATYGAAEDNTQFITLLYENVLNREPEAAGLQFHLDEFARGETRADMLTHFSESPENQANVIGQIANGMLYVPLA